MSTKEYMIGKLLSNNSVRHFMEYMKDNGGAYIAGGALTSVATGNHDKIEDYDVYFTDVNSAVAAIRYMKENNPHVSFVSDKSITYVMKDSVKIQFIYYAFYPKAEDIFAHYDFYINCAAYDAVTQELVVHENFWMHNAQRYIGVNVGTKFPILSNLRLDKYIKRGYHTSRNEVLKISLAIASLNIDSWEKAKIHIGNTYGFTLADFEDCEKELFSMEKLIERIESCNEGLQSNTLPMQEQYLYPHDAVDFLLLGKPIEVYTINGCKFYKDPYVEDAALSVEALVERGLLTEVEVDTYELLSQKFYLVAKGTMTLGVQQPTKWDSGRVYTIGTLPTYISGGNSETVYEVTIKEEDIAEYSGGQFTVSHFTPVAIVGIVAQMKDYKNGVPVVYKPVARMRGGSANERGWVFNANQAEMVAKIQKVKEDKLEHLRAHVIKEGGSVGYAHNTFTGVILQGGEDITPFELLCYMDDFNLSFGGNISIREDGTFSGRYNTD